MVGEVVVYFDDDVDVCERRGRGNWGRDEGLSEGREGNVEDEWELEREKTLE